jgi:hypothetical protein
LQSSLHEANAVIDAPVKQLSEEEQKTKSLSTQACALAGRLEQETVHSNQAAQGREQSLKMDILCREEHMQRRMSQIDCGAKVVQVLVMQTDTLQQDMDYLADALTQASASKGPGILSYGCEQTAAERDRECERLREAKRIHDRELESTVAMLVMLKQERLQKCRDLDSDQEKKHAQEIAKEKERCQLLECKLIGETHRFKDMRSLREQF